MTIQAGRLRHHVAVERFVATGRGDRGQPAGEWQRVYAEVPAWIEPLSGRQLEITRQLVATATHRVTMRYHPGILPGMRLAYQGRHFAVGYVGDGDLRKHYLELTTTEQQTGATNG